MPVSGVSIQTAVNAGAGLMRVRWREGRRKLAEHESTAVAAQN